MNLQQLTTFCTVIGEGSMTAAAEKLFLTQPAVSQQIRNLEEELGVEILVRGTRQVKPTLQGQLLYDYAKRILQLTQQAQVAIQGISQDVSGHMRIATLNSIGLYMISPIIGLFLKHNARLRIQLVYGSGERIINEMRNHQVDLVILPDLKTEFSVDFPDYNKRFLYKDDLWLVGSGRDTTLPSSIELKGYPTRPVVSFTEQYPGFNYLLEKKLQEKRIQVLPAFETDNLGTLKRVIEAGMGWGFLPSHSIRKQVRMGRLTQIQVEDLRYSVPVNMYSPENPDRQAIYEVFYRALQQQSLS